MFLDLILLRVRFVRVFSFLFFLFSEWLHRNNDYIVHGRPFNEKVISKIHEDTLVPLLSYHYPYLKIPAITLWGSPSPPPYPPPPPLPQKRKKETRNVTHLSWRYHQQKTRDDTPEHICYHPLDYEVPPPITYGTIANITKGSIANDLSTSHHSAEPMVPTVLKWWTTNLPFNAPIGSRYLWDSLCINLLRPIVSRWLKEQETLEWNQRGAK